MGRGSKIVTFKASNPHFVSTLKSRLGLAILAVFGSEAVDEAVNNNSFRQ